MPRIRWSGGAIAALATVLVLGPVRAEDPVEDMALLNRQEAAQPQNQVAVLRGVDKITARVTDIEAPAGKAVRYGSLEIVARTCSKRPPEEPPEVTAFVEVADIKPDGTKEDIFNGWMFASSPAISALEHPVYDVWVIDCKTRAPGA
jgi:hypothetical protein